MTATNHNGVYILGKEKPEADKQPKADAKRIAEAKERTKEYIKIMENTCVCCGSIIPEGTQVCQMCVDSVKKRSYMKFDCPECGAPLEVWADYLVAKSAARFGCFGYERRDLIRHCKKCHCDWENEWCTEFGDVVETQLRRKFWG